MRFRSMSLVLCTLLAFSAIPPAGAHGRAARDRASDNEVSFTYDEGSGAITRRSSEESGSRKAVAFLVGISEAEGTGSGLVGRIKLRLRGDDPVTFDGWFTLDVTTSEGSPAFNRQRPATIVLRPQPGQRRATLTFRFDVPSGTYDAAAAFDAS